MKMLRRLLGRKIGTGAAEGYVAEYAGYLFGLFILVFGLRRLTSLETTEAQLFVGVVAVVCTSLLCMATSMLLSIYRMLQARVPAETAKRS